MKDELYPIVEKVSRILKEKSFKIAVAESCTGGLLSSCLTDIQGSSAYFALGVVAYNNIQKHTQLNIEYDLIEKYSAVSVEIASLMARNVRLKADTDIGVGLTGYAGPDSQNKDAPVGTVYISIDFRSSNYTEKKVLTGSRKEIKQKSVKSALDLIMRHSDKSV